MSEDDPVTIWLEGLRKGDDSAARKMWSHFVSRLYEVTKNKIHPDTRRVYDEEDAAQSAFRSLCAGIAAGRYPDLNDRTDLWRLLLVISTRKVSHRHRYDKQECRDVRRTAMANVFSAAADSAPSLLDQLTSHEPTPEFAAEFVDTCGALFDNMEDPTLRRVGWLKLEGFRDGEVAAQLNCSKRTVQRKVELIRRNWLQQQMAEQT